MTSLGEAIHNKLEQQRHAHLAAAGAFTPDPELEELGKRLDTLREIDPDQYNHPGLAADRQRVATYRVRKANHKEIR